MTAVCDIIYSPLSRASTAKELYARFSLVCPTKVRAWKTQKFLIVENKEHWFDFVTSFYFLSICFKALHSGKVSQSTSDSVIEMKEFGQGPNNG